MSIFDQPEPFTKFKPREYRQPLGKAKADETMQKLTGYTTSALQTGLDILDKPGRAVRGLLGGNLREGLAWAPFSDTVGATDPSQKVTGRDLTNKLGLTNKYRNGWGEWGMGLGAEMLTDPLTYFTGGAHHALTEPGKALAKLGATRGLSRAAMIEGFHGTESALATAGRSVDDIAHMRNQGARIATPEMEKAVLDATGKPLLAHQPLGGLGGFGIPFRSPSAIFGTGPTAAGIAGKMDRLGEKLKYKTMLGRWGNALFDSRAGDAIGGDSQKAMVDYGADALEAARQTGRRTTDNMAVEIAPIIKAGGDEGQLLRGSRQAAEAVRFRGVDPSLHSSASNVGNLFHDAEVAQRVEAQRIGLPLSELDDPHIQYGPRQGNDIAAAKDLVAGIKPTTRSLANPQVANRNNIPVATGANFHRDEVYRAVPGGSEQLNDFAVQFAGAKGKSRPIERSIQRTMLAEAIANGTPFSRDLVHQLRTKSEELTAKLKGLPEEHATHDIGLYSNNITQDAGRSAEQHAQTMRAGKMMHGFLADNARNKHLLASDAVPISKVLDDLGFTHNRAADLATGTPMDGALVQAYQGLAKQGAGPVTPFLMGKTNDLRKAVDNYAISRAHYNELIATHAKASLPQTLQEPAGIFRNLTSTFKNFAYPLWVPSHVRNSTSALGNNLSRGINFDDHFGSAGAGRVMRGTAKADDLRRIMPGDIPAGMSDEAARDYVRHEAFATGKVGDGHAGQSDLDNAIAARLQSLTPGRVTPEPFGSGRTGTGSFVGDTGRLIGGGIKEGLSDVVQHVRKNPFQSPLGPGGLRSPVKNVFGDGQPLRQAGVWGGQTDNAALRVGRTAGSNIEDFFRLANYLGNRRMGASSTEAGMRLRDLHFDYDNLTKFEKNVMRQVIPFYTYMRKNLPLQAGYLAHTPVQPLTQMRLMNGARSKDDYVPDHLAGGAAIPIGSETKGNQRYISSLGTPLEEAMSRFRFKDGLPDIRGTAMQFAAQGNPFIKAPLEQLFGTQLSSGRQLADLRAQGLAKAAGSLWGDDNPQFLAQMMANSPFSRVFSTFDQATDDRKPFWARALNMGTGLKVTDVNLDKARASEAARARNEILSSMPHIAQYTNFYPRKGEEGNLKPDEVEMLQMLRTMQERAKEANKREGPLHIGIAR
jgi:hypothetical protein